MIKQLIHQFIPEHYQLEIQLDEAQLRFSGQLLINGKLPEASQLVQLHAKDLTITAAQIDQQIVSHATQGDVVSLQASAELAAGSHQLRLEFSGNISDTMTGLYPSRFSHQDKSQIIFATQFESHHAREVFPCIDEPAAKATFQLILETTAEAVTLSNTVAESEVLQAGRKNTTFKITPRMSSYLLAFVSGPLHSQEVKTKTGTLIRCWASQAQQPKLLRFALQEAVKIQEFFEDYFQTAFPLEKCDHIALPDFDSGAMENWGLITYRERIMLTDPDNQSVDADQLAAVVIAHELSHQWFGNLVTMAWWDDLWLNESFATFMEHLALAKLHPEWQQWETYALSDAALTVSRDINKDIQAVYTPVDDPELIESLFDPAIVYAKGGRLLKMVWQLIGEQAFQTGLQDYFKQFAYQNTTRDDLWHCLAQASQLPIADIMNPWLTQPGLPLVTVSQTGRKITVNQQRFCLDPIKEQANWPIPLLGADPSTAQFILDQTEATLEAHSDKPILLNAKGSGHFVSLYADKGHRAALIKQLVTSPDIEARLNFFNDMILLARQGAGSLLDCLDFAIQLQNEPRDSVWGLIGTSFSYARQLVGPATSPGRQLLKRLGNLAKPAAEQLGWQTQPNEDANTRQLRATLLAHQVASDDPDYIATALQIYSENQADLYQLPADFKSIILSAAVRHSDASQQLLGLYKTTSSADFQIDLVSALTSTRKQSDLDLLIPIALQDPAFVRNQDLLTWLVRLLTNPYTASRMWDWLEAEWSTISVRLAGSKSLDSLPVYLSRGLNSKQWLLRYDKFFTERSDIKVFQRNADIGRADIKAAIRWRQREESLIIGWLRPDKI